MVSSKYILSEFFLTTSIFLNAGGDRPRRNFEDRDGGDRPPRDRNGDGGDRPRRDRNDDGGDRPPRDRNGEGGEGESEIEKTHNQVHR